MRNITCLVVIAAGACTQPDEQVISLSDLSGVRVRYHVTSSYVGVTLQYDENKLGSCAILRPEFEGYVNDIPMVITDRGSHFIDGICSPPILVLRDPPAASSASIRLSDSSLALTCHIGQLPPLRPLTLSPDASWQCRCVGASMETACSVAEP
jgi:hypothetical protein